MIENAFQTGLLLLAMFDVECKAPRAPVVEVKPIIEHVQYDFTKTREEMNAFEIDTVSPYLDNKGDLHLNGMMSGLIRPETKIYYQDQTWSNGKGCVHIDKISVSIKLEPTIFIVNHLKPGTCKHEAVLEHEKKHLKIDQFLIDTYVSRIEKTLKLALAKYGHTYGPYQTEQLPFYREKLKEYYFDMVRAEQKRLQDERRIRHQALDSYEEYERVNNACK